MDSVLVPAVVGAVSAQVGEGGDALFESVDLYLLADHLDLDNDAETAQMQFPRVEGRVVLSRGVDLASGEDGGD